MSDIECWTIEQKTHPEILDILRSESGKRPWCNYFLHDPPLRPSNLNSVCRLEFVPYDRCIQDRYFYIDKSRTPEALAAGGITTQINWDFDANSLPPGWQGAVRQSFNDSQSGKHAPNTLVALLAFTTQKYRGQGMAGRVLSKMCRTALSRGYRYCIVPALPPTQFEKEHPRTPMGTIASLKRENGQALDYWIRLHLRKGATIIGHCDQSHRFVFSLKDFERFVSSDPIPSTGEHVIRLDKDQMLGPNNENMWQLVYADVERDFVHFDWGCVWVQYDLQNLNFA